MRSNYTSHLTPGEKLLHRLQCRFLGCDFVKDGEKPTKEHLSTPENVSKESESILDETKQPSLDDSTAPTKNIVVLYANTPSPNEQHNPDNIVMLHHPCEPNVSAPNNACKSDATALPDKSYYTRISFRHLRELETLGNIWKNLPTS